MKSNISVRDTLPKEGQKNHRTDKLWQKRGLEDVFFQRETEINFLSILIGLAVGALLTQFFVLVEQVQASRWHLLLYFTASIIIVIHTWITHSWGTLVLKYPISFALVVPHFLTDFSLAIMCLLVTHPSGWFAAVSSLLLLSVIGQLNIKKSGLWGNLSTERGREIITGLWVYAIFSAVALAACIYLFYFPTKTNEIILGGVALLCSVAAAYMQHMGMEKEKKELGVP